MPPVVSKEKFNAFKKIVEVESPGLVQLINEYMGISSVDEFKQMDHSIQEGLKKLVQYPDCHSYYSHLYNGVRSTIITHYQDLMEKEMEDVPPPGTDGQRGLGGWLGDQATLATRQQPAVDEGVRSARPVLLVGGSRDEQAPAQLDARLQYSFDRGQDTGAAAFHVVGAEPI